MEKDLPKEPEQLLTPGEVAVRLRVDPKTVTRWAAAGRLPSIRTPGGHRRFRKSLVDAILDGRHDPRAAVVAGKARPELKPDAVNRLLSDYRSGSFTVAALAAKYGIGIGELYAYVGVLTGLDQTAES